jgi:hypothetical protein
MVIGDGRCEVPVSKRNRHFKKLNAKQGLKRATGPSTVSPATNVGCPFQAVLWLEWYATALDSPNDKGSLSAAYPTQAKVRLEWGTQRSLPVQEIRAVAFYGTANLSRRAVEAVPFVQLRRLW